MENPALRVVLSLFLLAGLLAGCNAGKELSAYVPGNGGSPKAGKFVILKYKCGSCHIIPGIRHANGIFGPPLNFIADRSVIGGNFPNDQATLQRWVLNPPAMKPKTAMPDLGLSPKEAQEVVAYLETLR